MNEQHYIPFWDTPNGPSICALIKSHKITKQVPLQYQVYGPKNMFSLMEWAQSIKYKIFDIKHLALLFLRTKILKLTLSLINLTLSA